MNKKVFFIWSICLLAIMPLLAGCDKDDDEEELIIVESFEGTDGMEGERILFELEDVPAVVRHERNGYVSLCYSEYADEYYIDKQTTHSSEIVKDLIAIKSDKFDNYDIPLNSKVYISASVTNLARPFDDSVLDDDWFWLPNNLIYQKKAYLKEIRKRN